MRRASKVALLWLLGSAMTFPLAAQVFYFTNGPSLFRSEFKGADLLPGDIVTVGTLGFDSVDALDFHPHTGELYGMDLATGQILLVDTDTGGATPVVSGLLPYCEDHFGRNVPMSFDASGQLWLTCNSGPAGLPPWNGLFLRIDVEARTVEAGPTLSSSFFAVSPSSLFFIHGAMYLAANVQVSQSGPSHQTVIQVDPATGALLRTLNFPSIDGIVAADYDPASGTVLAGDEFAGPQGDGILKLTPASLTVARALAHTLLRGLAVAPVAAASIPTLNAGGLGFLALLLGVAGAFALGRRSTG